MIGTPYNTTQLQAAMAAHVQMNVPQSSEGMVAAAPHLGLLLFLILHRLSPLPLPRLPRQSGHAWPIRLSRLTCPLLWLTESWASWVALDLSQAGPVLGGDAMVIGGQNEASTCSKHHWECGVPGRVRLVAVQLVHLL